MSEIDASGCTRIIYSRLTLLPCSILTNEEGAILEIKYEDLSADQ